MQGKGLSQGFRASDNAPLSKPIYHIIQKLPPPLIGVSKYTIGCSHLFETVCSSLRVETPVFVRVQPQSQLSVC